MGTRGTLRKLLKLILVDGGWAASFCKGQQVNLEKKRNAGRKVSLSVRNKTCGLKTLASNGLGQGRN